MLERGVIVYRGASGSGKTWKAKDEAINDANDGRTVVVVAEYYGEYLDKRLVAKVQINNWCRLRSGVNILQMPSQFDYETEWIRFFGDFLSVLDNIPADSTVVIDALDKIITFAKKILSERGYDSFVRDVAYKINRLASSCKVIITTQRSLPESFLLNAQIYEVGGQVRETDKNSVPTY